MAHELSNFERYILKEIALGVHSGSRLSEKILKHNNRIPGLVYFLAHLPTEKPRCVQKIGVVYSALPMKTTACKGCYFALSKPGVEGDYSCELGIDPTAG